MAAGHLSRAREWMERALDLEPDRVELLTAMANVQSQAGELLSACDTLRRAVAICPTDPLLHVLLGSVCVRLGQVDEF